jgi:hypothetical protein
MFIFHLRHSTWVHILFLTGETLEISHCPRPEYRKHYHQYSHVQFILLSFLDVSRSLKLVFRTEWFRQSGQQLQDARRELLPALRSKLQVSVLRLDTGEISNGCWILCPLSTLRGYDFT